MHLLFLPHASPEKLRRYAWWVNNVVKYRVLDQPRNGWHQPFLSHAPFGMIDVRIKKEFAARFLRDSGAKPTKLFFRCVTVKHKVTFLLYAFLALLRLVTPLTYVEKAGGQIENPAPGGWINLWFVGALEDDTVQGGEYL